MLSITSRPDLVEADLVAERLCCPVYEGPLSPWGFARERGVRMLYRVRSARPRRVRCASCKITHVRLQAWSVPRRRDTAEVIDHALLARAQIQSASLRETRHRSRSQAPGLGACS